MDTWNVAVAGNAKLGAQVAQLVLLVHERGKGFAVDLKAGIAVHFREVWAGGM